VARPRCPHGREICWEHVLVDDAAKRAFDAVRLLTVFTDWDTRIRQSPYVAIRLIDGGSDGVMYDSKQAAVRHQLHEMSCAYFSFRTSPNGFSSPRDAAVFLLWHRVAYDNGFRLPDPDDRHGGQDLVMPDMREHLTNQLMRLIGGRRA
jgi:hypothetical protein